MKHDDRGTTVPTLLEWRAKATPEAAAYAREVRSGQWTTVSWRSFSEQVEQLRRALHAAGLRRGSRLAIVAPVSLEWELLHHAALALGVVVIGFDSHDHPDRVARMCDVAAVAAFALHGPTALDVVGLDRLARASLVVDIAGELGSPGLRLTRWSELLATGADHVTELTQPRGEDLATIVFTSGTTGEPKGIGYSHGQLMLAAGAIADAFQFVDERGRLLCWLPLSNLFQRMVNLAAVMNGPVTHLLPDPRRVMDAVASVEPDVFIGVPRFFEKLYEGVQDRISALSPPLRWLIRRAWVLGRAVGDAREAGREVSLIRRLLHAAADRLVLSRVRGVMGRRLRCMVSGSAPMPKDLLHDFDAIGWLVLEAYGLSENVLPMAMNRVDDYCLGSVGRPLPDNQIRVEPDGAILVRGPGVFSGYLGEAPGASTDGQGFCRTGDLGYVDERGYLWLTGRASELIKTSTGRRVSPLAPEARLRRIEGIEQAMVVGDGHKCLVALCACTGPQLAPARLKLEGACRAVIGDMPAQEQPLAVGFIERPFDIGAGEITANLKLRRGAIAREHAQLIETLYAMVERETPAARGAVAFLWPEP